MKAHHLSAFLGLFVSLLVFPSAAFAGPYLDCIADAKGQKILWNSSWARDKKDNDVEYKIAKISKGKRVPTRRVAVELVAIGPANIPRRKSVVKTEDRAQEFCERVMTEAAALRISNQEQSEISNLPFIKYTEDGWVRAEATEKVSLVLCRIGELRFSCSESDREKNSAALRALEEDLKAQTVP